jgi:hypothetical protein
MAELRTVFVAISAALLLMAGECGIFDPLLVRMHCAD